MHPLGPPAPAAPRHRLLPRCAVATLGAAALLAVLLVAVKSGWSAGIDRHWTDALHHYARAHTAWTAAWQTLTDLGGPLPTRLVLGLAAVWLWWIGARVLASWTLTQALLGWVAELALKAAVGRPRPAFLDPVSYAAGPAFPSGHTMAATITGITLVALVWPRADRVGRTVACLAAGLGSVAVGFSRLALGVHWPTDVLGGFLAAAAVVGAVTIAFELGLPGGLAGDVRTVDWRTRPRVQRVIVHGGSSHGGSMPRTAPPGTAGAEPDTR